MAQAISKMETSQTAVSWLIEEIHKNMGVWIPLHIQDQAKAMEKEQIIKAFSDGQELSINNPLLPHYSSDEYYKDTYNNQLW